MPPLDQRYEFLASTISHAWNATDGPYGNMTGWTAEYQGWIYFAVAGVYNFEINATDGVKMVPH